MSIWICVGSQLLLQLARHSEMNRLKILGAFERVPNIIELAKDRVETFPRDSNPKSARLHQSVRDLQLTLLRTLPVLIDKLIPGTFGETTPPRST